MCMADHRAADEEPSTRLINQIPLCNPVEGALFFPPHPRRRRSLGQDPFAFVFAGVASLVDMAVACSGFHLPTTGRFN